jgi:hypothetical protein
LEIKEKAQLNVHPPDKKSKGETRVSKVYRLREKSHHQNLK